MDTIMASDERYLYKIYILDTTWMLDFSKSVACKITSIYQIVACMAQLYEIDLNK